MMKTAIVTGGSRGIGAAIVKMLAEEGYNVIINYNRSEEIAKRMKEEFTSKGYLVETFKADVSKREEVNKLVEFTIQKFKNIDVLVNNAGISQTKLFTDITDEDWQNMIGTNLNSVCYICHYSVAKAGVDAMTKSLAKELGPSNIRVNSIAPGIIDTDMNRYLSTEELEQITEEIPLGKIGNTSAIAKCAKWLMEDDYTTGQIISINGGLNIN